MKYIQKYQLFEDVNGFKFKFEGEDDGMFTYTFNDGDNQFIVEIDRYQRYANKQSNKLDDNEVEIRYLVKSDDEWTYKMVHTNIYKILKTIFGDIIPHFTENNEWCTTIIINGLGKSREQSEVTQRTKIYYRYLTNNPIKNWSIDRDGNEIYLDKIN